MEVFGFVCSGYCKGKAENQGIVVPSYAGTRAKAEAKQWKRAGTLVAVVVIAFLAFMGAWGWYAWVGSVPKAAFSLRFPDAASSGQVRFRGPQAVLLHGGRLVRHDTASKQEVWSTLLLEKKKIADEAASIHKGMVEARQKGIEAGVDYSDSLPTLSELIESMERDAAAAMHLHLRNEGVWVSFPDKLVQFDWQTGKSAQEIPLAPGERRYVEAGDELLVERVGQGVTRLNLASGEVRTEDLPSESPPSTGTRIAGKTPAPGTPSGSKPSDTVRAQNLSTPARAVLPAVNAAKANQQRLAGEMASGTSAHTAATATPANAMARPPGDSRVVLSPNATYQITARPIGNKLIDGETVNAQRVILRRLGTGSSTEWTGELPGIPELHPLKTVDVLSAGKSLLVLDKSQQKRWEAKLNRAVPAPSRPLFMMEIPPAGEGPCAERGDTLYVFDSAGLTAFELAGGAVRWTLAAADSTGLFLDDQGAIYLNGITSGSDKAQAMVTKVDPKTGKQLWRVEREGPVAYVEGKFVYTMESYIGDDDESDGIVGSNTIFHVPAFLRLKRLDPTNGRILWSHHQTRCPLDVQFDKTTIQLLFRKELQTLTYLSL